MTSLTVSHSINLVEGTPLDSAPPASDTFTYALDRSSPASHLESLAHHLGLARADLNTRLTEWKLAVKHLESPKAAAAARPNKQTGDDDDDDGDVQDDDDDDE